MINKNKKEAETKEFVISAKMGKGARKIKNWPASNDNELYGFWLKHLTDLHSLIAKQFKNILQRGEIKERFSGKTYLTMKDPAKRQHQTTTGQFPDY